MTTRRPVDNTTRENFVYSMHDGQGRVLYIGVTRNPDLRWRGHAMNNPGLTEATVRCKMRGPYLRPVALRLERAAILQENPLFNLEVDGKYKRPLVNDLNAAATARERERVVGRYEGVGA